MEADFVLPRNKKTFISILSTINILPLTIALVRILLTNLGLIRSPRNFPFYFLAILPSSVRSGGLSQGTQGFLSVFTGLFDILP